MSSSKSSPPPRTQPAPPPAPPPAWRRALLIALLLLLFWLAFHLRPRGTRPTVIYASRYSKEFKYRPAASPVITERLKDGRVRLRGALPS